MATDHLHGDVTLTVERYPMGRPMLRLLRLHALNALLISNQHSLVQLFKTLAQGLSVEP